MKTIGFHTKGLPFNGATLSERALGGSETALIQMARSLADLGHRVMVFNECLRPGVYNGVEYLRTEDFPRRLSNTRFDVFVVSRHLNFFHLAFPAGLKVLWNHDTLDYPDLMRSAADGIDLMFVLSAFHRDNFLTRIPGLLDKILVTRNGIDLDLIDRASKGVIKDPNKAIYASRPERGLKVLLEHIWPKLTRERPEMKLYICGYDVDRERLDAATLDQYQYLDRLAGRAGNVIRLGALPKTEYYRHLAEASVMLYPCTFPEISCIAALEAQACRTPVLATDAFALTETIAAPEFRVPGRPGSDQYHEDYLARAGWILDCPEASRAAADRAREEMEKRYAWPVIAAEWDRIFNVYLKSRFVAAR